VAVRSVVVVVLAVVGGSLVVGAVACQAAAGIEVGLGNLLVKVALVMAVLLVVAVVKTTTVPSHGPKEVLDWVGPVHTRVRLSSALAVLLMSVCVRRLLIPSQLGSAGSEECSDVVVRLHFFLISELQE